MSKFLEHQRVDRGLRGLILAEFEICFGKKNIEFIIQHLNTKFNLKLSVDAYKYLLRDKEYAVDISYFSGVCEAITKLLELGFTIRLLTNGNKDQQQQKIKSLSRTMNLCDKVVYAEEFAPKPDPVGINFIVKYEKINKSEVLFVGDSKTDYDCAVKAHVDFMFAKDFFGIVSLI
jgi:phosphoglycolate phosphatase-like HAD superfamily hydrolase